MENTRPLATREHDRLEGNARDCRWSALLRQPKLLILDEATSALDMENEAHIMQNVYSLRGSMTILVVSHRSNAVREADTLHVFDHALIVASGSWAEVRDEARMHIHAPTARARA